MFQSLINFAFGKTPTETAQSIIKQLDINSNHSLPENYFDLFQESSKEYGQPQIFKEFLKEFKNITTASGVIKFLTVQLKIIRVHEYDECYL